MMNRTLLYSVWFLAGVSLLSLILSRELSAFAMLSIVLLLPFLFYLERNGRLKKIPWLENFLVLFFFILSLIRFFYFNANFLLAVAEFLIAFLLVKMAFKKERKDLMQVMILSIFVLLSAATLATDFSFFFSFLFFTIALCIALTLYTLSEGHPLQKDGGQKKKLLVQYLFRNAAVTLMLTILFSISIFIFFPRLSLAVFQGAFLAPARKSGFSDSLNLSSTGKIFEDAGVTMRVEILRSGEKPIQTPLYIKGQTLVHFDGVRWTQGEKKSVWLVADSFRSRILKAQKVVRNRFSILGEEPKAHLKKQFSLKLGRESELFQKIYLESLEGTHLFAVPWAEEIFAKAPQILVAEDGTLQRPANFSGRAVYEVRSILERPAERILYSLSPAAQTELQKELQIPLMEFGFSHTKELLTRIVSKKDSPAMKAKKIEKFFKGGEFHYSLENPAKQSANPVEEFLFETKQGHCEYFASAMALLLRLAGIPSRVATGFLAQEWNPEGGYFIVRGKDAHAWVEAYVGDGLWLEFDPSPRVIGADLEQEGFWVWVGLKRKLDYLNFLWNAYVLSYDMESQKSLARNVELKLKSVQFSKELDLIFARGRRWFQKQIHSVHPPLKGWATNGWATNGRAIYLLLILFILSVLTCIKLKYYFKNRRGKEPAIDFYRQMLKLLSKKGFKKLDSETPMEFTKRVLDFLSQSKKGERGEGGEFFKEIETLTLLFCKIRYSGYTPVPAEFSEANRSLTHLKRSL